MFGGFERRAVDSRQPETTCRVDGWLRIIQNLVYPATCLLCGDPGHDLRDICPPCLKSLPYLGIACPRCGEPLPMESPEACGKCQRHPPAQDRLIAVFRYEEPVRHLIQGLKFGSRHAHARLLGTFLAERLRDHADLPGLLLPVPLHSSRYRRRGFNQSLEIARFVARDLGITLDHRVCRRTRPTPEQARLSAADRLANIRQAFELAAPLPCDHVAILDDVVTTGATVGELAKVLRQGGATRIEVWACARTLVAK